jgi:hypothetical protein
MYRVCAQVCQRCCFVRVCARRDWAQYASTDLGAQASDRLIPDQYIVVFKGYDDLVQGAELVQSSVLASGKAASVLGQFDSLFQGLTVACSSATLDRLAALPGVVAIVPDAIITLDETQDVSQVWVVRAPCVQCLCECVSACWVLWVYTPVVDWVGVCVALSPPSPPHPLRTSPAA